MIPRLALARLRQNLRQFPVVALLGPRQVGKMTLALALAEELGDAAVYVDLELPSDRVKVTDPELYFSAHDERLVILVLAARRSGDRPGRVVDTSVLVAGVAAFRADVTPSRTCQPSPSYTSG